MPVEPPVPVVPPVDVVPPLPVWCEPPDPGEPPVPEPLLPLEQPTATRAPSNMKDSEDPKVTKRGRLVTIVYELPRYVPHE